MKKYIKMLPIIFYPYIYMICFAIYNFAVFNIDTSVDIRSIGQLLLLVIAIVCNIYSASIVIVNLVLAQKGRYAAKELAKLNMIIKLVHIPAYILHFILGAIGLIASVWGIGFILWAVIIDLLTIGLSGMVGISASICCVKENILSKTMAAFYAILSFIYCIDVVGAVVFFIKANNADKNRNPAAI